MAAIRFRASFCLILSLMASSAGAAPRPSAESSTATDFYGDPLPPGAVARMGTIRLRHADPSVVFAANGKTLISCGSDGSVRHWDVATGALLREKRLWRRREERGRFDNRALAPNGATIAVGQDGIVYLLDTNTAEERGRLALGSCAIEHLTFSPDGKKLAVRVQEMRGKKTIQLWDVAGRRKHRTLAHKDEFPGIPVFSPDGKILATATGINVLRLWDTATGELLRSKHLDAGGVAFSPDGAILATSGRFEGEAKLWDTATLNERASLKLPDEVKGNVTGLTFSPDGVLLAARSPRGAVVWEVAARKERCRLPEHTFFNNPQLAFAPDGKTLACWSEGAEIRLWDVTRSRRLHPRSGHDTAVWALAMSPDGKHLASVGAHDLVLCLWDAASGEPLRSLEARDPWIRCCAFSADGKRVAAGGDAGTVQVWDTATGTEWNHFEIRTANQREHEKLDVRALRFSSDGKRLAALGVSYSIDPSKPSLLHVWDTESGVLLSRRAYKVDTRTKVHSGGLTLLTVEIHAAFTPDVRGITVRAGARPSIEDVATGRVLRMLPENVGRPLTFSPDGRLLAAGALTPKPDPFDGYTMDGLSLIETASGQEVLRITTGQGHLLAFSADGRMLASVDREAMHVWDTATGAERFRRPWSEQLVTNPSFAPVSSLAFLPDGRRVATGMDDGTILVWRVTPTPSRGGGPARDLDDKRLSALWADLAGEARAAHRALHALADAPAQAVPLLRQRLRPAEPVDARRIAKLIAALDDNRFATRETAAKELAQLGERGEPALRRALAAGPSLEVRKRIEQILQEPKMALSAEMLRCLRAIAVLERLGTTQAADILRTLAAGAADVPQTRAANAALSRLMGRPR